MALVTTIAGVIGVLAAMALLLWFSAYIENRQLGPLSGPGEGRPPVHLVEEGVAPTAVAAEAAA